MFSGMFVVLPCMHVAMFLKNSARYRRIQNRSSQAWCDHHHPPAAAARDLPALCLPLAPRAAALPEQKIIPPLAPAASVSSAQPITVQIAWGKSGNPEIQEIAKCVWVSMTIILSIRFKMPSFNSLFLFNRRGWLEHFWRSWEILRSQKCFWQFNRKRLHYISVKCTFGNPNVGFGTKQRHPEHPQWRVCLMLKYFLRK